LFDALLRFGFLKINSQSNNLWLLRRKPVGFFNNDFDWLEKNRNWMLRF